MKATALKRLFGTYLLPHLPGYYISGRMLLAGPLEHLLRGFFFDASGFDASWFYLQVFVQPLYVPSDHISFNFGQRIAGWKINKSNEDEVMSQVLLRVREEGLPLLERIQVPLDLAQYVAEQKNIDDPYVQEARAYSLIIAGEHSQGLEGMEQLLKTLARHIEREPGVYWLQDLHKRNYTFYNLLSHNSEAAIKQLEEWRAYTLRSLNLV